MQREPKELSKKVNNSPDYLTPLLHHGPLGWAIIRANELKALENVDFKSPILDVGCGDGMVAKVFFAPKKQKVDWGIDISQSELDKAKKSGVYRNLVLASVYSLPFEDNSFNTVFSNSVMEHIPKLDEALREISRVLKKKGSLIITVPTPYISKYLLLNDFFNSLKLGIISKGHASIFNRFFKHHNLHDHEGWEKLMEKHSLKLIKYEYYHSAGLIQLHELLTFASIPQQVIKIFTGTWLALPIFRRQLTKFVTRNYRNDIDGLGASVLLIAEKS